VGGIEDWDLGFFGDLWSGFVVCGSSDANMYMCMYNNNNNNGN